MRTGRRPAFTLVELMVVAAIIAVLLTLTIPAVTGIVRSSHESQAVNLVRASLTGARFYAMEKGVVAGLRFQQDGSIVPVYARNSNETLSLQNYTAVPLYDMKSVEGEGTTQLPGAWRVTVADVGNCSNISTSGGLIQTWIGPGTGNHLADPRWYNDGVDAWFVYPTVLFAPSGKVILGDCIYRSNPPWNPSLNGAFGKVVDINYTNQTAWAGWRSTTYEGVGGSQDIPVLTPTTTMVLRVFDYASFRGEYAANRNNSLYALLETGIDCMLDPNTGMVVRMDEYSTDSN
ncbi:MAG: hypothetical protein BIFFINMI_02615 [Phycisphaerae bacterium]|nr:hypothetical protein [Phycisphaerae bacterium]